MSESPKPNFIETPEHVILSNEVSAVEREDKRQAMASEFAAFATEAGLKANATRPEGISPTLPSDEKLPAEVSLGPSTVRSPQSQVRR